MQHRLRLRFVLTIVFVLVSYFAFVFIFDLVARSKILTLIVFVLGRDFKPLSTENISSAMGIVSSEMPGKWSFGADSGKVVTIMGSM